MAFKRSENDLVVTQVSVAGFADTVTAKELSDYLEENIGIVWRCRLKTSSTPHGSYPNFEVNTADVQSMNYEKVTPHAFVHFVIPDRAKSALDAAVRSELILFKRPLRVSLGPENPHRMNHRRMNIEPFKLSDVRLEIGLLASRDEFFVSWRGNPTGVDFVVDSFDGRCKFLFAKDTAFSFEGKTQHAVIKCDFRVEFLVRDINEVTEYKDTSYLIILLQLTSSPLVYYRTADDDIEESLPLNLLDDDDPWIRTTDFTPSGAIGRCNTFRLMIQPRHRGKLNKTMNYLRECRVPKVYAGNQLLVRDEPDFGMPLVDPFFCIQYKKDLTFKILFLVNVVMQKGIINQHQLSDRFFDLLRSQPEEVNVAALKHLYSYRHPLYDAYGGMKLLHEWLLKNPKLFVRPREMDETIEVRRLVITPTRAYCLLPEIEISNRVLRNYRELSDRFIRVTFMDEGMQMLNKAVLKYYVAPIVRDVSSNSTSQKTGMFKRVKTILSRGFYLCGRKYSFLAFSANQLRDRSAWFFAEGPNTSVRDIITWMGKFTNKNVAKCAARMGQCFSSTYPTVRVPRNEVDLELPDIKRNGYVFSDGIGKISPDLAREVAERLQLSVNPPSAYQIRYAGFKGVVACWPAENDKIRLSLRRSMDKFISNHDILEICSWTRLQPGFLNRQIVTLLSTLGVQDEIFWEMQDTMVSKLNQMLVDNDVAFDVLTASCAEQGNTAAIMLSAGFKPQTEPHLRGMLTSIRAAQLGDLREKARIFVPQGRWLMGCLDELGVLEQGQCFVQVSNPSLEKCFSKHGSKFTDVGNSRVVVKGLVAVAKNPCLHPGDVRILEAIDVPGLHHLFDCLVFPQKGERPHADEASGSDLDGDLYFVTWDQNLIPPSKRSWTPMEYIPAKEKVLPREVRHLDIIDFFSRNMVNENLGAICNAHVVHADLNEYGALDEKCLKLAELAALAVDFPKTGKNVFMPSQLKPKLYPDFMGKEEFKSYKSTKILGKLYRQAKDVYNEDVAASSELASLTGSIPYDTDLEIPGSTTFIAEAWNSKCIHDRQLIGLLGQYNVNREEEVVTGHIWSMPKNNSKKQGELKERLKHAYSAMRKEFRKVFEHMDSDFDKLAEDEQNIMYEQKASAWYQVTYHADWVKKSLELQVPDSAANDVKLSFAWIATDYLARIKIRRRENRRVRCRVISRRGNRRVDSTKPIDSLARYLADRI
ncbi:hypothetical protein RJ639_001916 [Escallonia herrerae]|uniref:RNA-dependent RNA polymerase n=1 Tax=Escallonia herrerae TaxID=1293975 RepID=A0AA88XJS4_9ASTE|nr:hypothetical protein RJ639_001916 [Escallonia herrerae]